MSSLRHGLVADAVSAPVVQPLAPPAGTAVQPRPVSMMRKFEVAALLPDLTVSVNQYVAPATPLFEGCASAFARGTLIETTRGAVAIEDLVPGDYVLTATGSEPVTWIGSTSYVPGHDDAVTSLTHMTRITAEAFGFGQPPMDVLVGPAARMVLRHPRLKTLLGEEAVLAPVSDYTDGDRYLQVIPAGTVQLYHLMLRRHTVIPVGGIEMETYHPGKAIGQGLGQNMRTLFLSLFPNLGGLDDFGQTTLTRTTRAVVDSLLDS